MNLLVDGRRIELHESVDRVVITKATDGTITVTSHFGVKREIIKAHERPPVATMEFAGPVNGKTRIAIDPSVPKVLRDGSTFVGGSVICPKCDTKNHSRQKMCKSGCGYDLSKRFKRF